MPTFDILPLDAALANSATGQNGVLLLEYIGYIQRVPLGQGGKLEPGVASRLGAARRQQFRRLRCGAMPARRCRALPCAPWLRAGGG